MRRLIIAISLTLALAACVQAKTYRLGVVPRESSGFYWDAIHAGVLRARNDLLKKDIVLEVAWLPPGGAGTAADQAALIGKAAAARFDGLLIAPIDVAVVGPAVEAAARGGMPVLIFDTPLSSARTLSYVGTNNYEAGQLAGGWLGKALGEQGSILVVGDAALPNVGQRDKGCIDGAHIFPNVFALSANDYADPVPAVRPAVAGAFMKKYAARLSGVFVADPAALDISLQGLEAAGLGQGKSRQIAFGGTPPVVAALRAGQIQALVADNPFGIGIQAVRTAIDALEGRRVEARISIPAVLVTADKIDDPANQMALHPPISDFLQDGQEIKAPPKDAAPEPAATP